MNVKFYCPAAEQVELAYSQPLDQSLSQFEYPSWQVKLALSDLGGNFIFLYLEQAKVL